MSQYGANLSRDLPNSQVPKRIIFYAQGLKIYGLLPYILNRKLKGEFISNRMLLRGWGRGASIQAPTGEDNYTVIPYTQTAERALTLLDWLYSGQGFEWAIAALGSWDDNLLEWNAYKSPPNVWVPAETTEGWREGFQRAVEGDLSAINLLKSQGDY